MSSDLNLHLFLWDLTTSPMPKAPPTLYNHNERCSVSCVLSVETSTSGCCGTLRSCSNHVVVPHSATAPQETEDYSMDFNGDFTTYSALESAPNPGDLDDDPPLQELGVIGIKVK